MTFRKSGVILSVLVLILTGCGQGIADSGGSENATLTPTPTAVARPTDAVASPAGDVHIAIEHGVSSQNTGDGFGLRITGWTPNGDVVFYMVGPDGEQIAVIPTDNPVQATQDGETSFLVSYHLEGLYPGLWLAVIAGPSGTHTINVEIPAE
jgi:hypothetical protein